MLCVGPRRPAELVGLQVDHLTTDHARPTSRPRQLRDEPQLHAGLQCIVVSGEHLERQRQQRVAGQDRGPVVECFPHRRLAAPDLVVVHRREVVVHERVAMHQLQRECRRHRLRRSCPEDRRALDEQERPDALAARHALRAASPRPAAPALRPRPARSLPGWASSAASTVRAHPASLCSNVIATLYFSVPGPRRSAVGRDIASERARTQPMVDPSFEDSRAGRADAGKPSSVLGRMAAAAPGWCVGRQPLDPAPRRLTSCRDRRRRSAALLALPLRRSPGLDGDGEPPGRRSGPSTSAGCRSRAFRATSCAPSSCPRTTSSAAITASTSAS